DLVIDPDGRGEGGVPAAEAERHTGVGGDAQHGAVAMTVDGESSTVAGGGAAVAAVTGHRTVAVDDRHRCQATQWHRGPRGRDGGCGRRGGGRRGGGGR